MFVHFRIYVFVLDFMNAVICVFGFLVVVTGDKYLLNEIKILFSFVVVYFDVIYLEFCSTLLNLHFFLTRLLIRGEQGFDFINSYIRGLSKYLV